MIYRYRHCVGITLFRLGRRKLEVWFCPGGEVIEPHSHPHIDSRLIIIAGSMTGEIGDRKGRTGWWDFLRAFVIPAGTIHGATITGRFCVFANLETWESGYDITSAAVDFERH